MPAARGIEKSEQGLNLHVKLSACHAEGRGFEPRRSRHLDQAFSSSSRVAIQLANGLRFNFLSLLRSTDQCRLRGALRDRATSFAEPAAWHRMTGIARGCS